MMKKNNFKKVAESIIAVGFKKSENQINILGSGFSIDANGKILSAAHLYNQLSPELRSGLVGMAMTKRDESGLEYYSWLPLILIDKDDKNDLAVFQLKNHDQTILRPIVLGDSNKVEVGDDAYFIGFPYAAQLINDGFGITLVTNKTIVSNIKQDGIDPNHSRNWFIVDAISNPGNSGCPLVSFENGKARVIGIMTITFRTQSKISPQLDIREPMHIAGAKPINLALNLLKD